MLRRADQQNIQVKQVENKGYLKNWILTNLSPKFTGSYKQKV